jgi:hypothetical protein
VCIYEREREGERERERARESERERERERESLSLSLSFSTWGSRGGPTPILGLNWFQTPINSQNWQQSFEINSFRTISCGIGKESEILAKRYDGF